MSRPVYTGPACAAFGSSPGQERYSYSPSLAPGIAFSIIFGLIVLMHIFHYVRALARPDAYRTVATGAKAPKRVHYLVLGIIGAALECAGWINRTIAHRCPYSKTLSTMEISVLIMGPAWTQALVYASCWALVIVLGRSRFLIHPEIYLWTSWVADCVCLSLQAVGGGLAGSAAANGEDPTIGTNIMVAGIVTQLVVAVAFSGLLAVILTNGSQQLRRDGVARSVAVAMIICMAMMILRGVYRSIELIQGWRGYLISTEAYIIWLDAFPMVIAMGVLAVLTPAFLLIRAASIDDSRSLMAALGERDSEMGESQSDGAFDEKELPSSQRGEVLPL